MAAPRQLKFNILDKPLNKGKNEISINAFAFLFSEIVQYCQNRVYSVTELQTKLAEMGYHVGQRIVDPIFLREKNFRRETKLLQMLIFIKTTLWKVLFGKEADELVHDKEDDKTYYIMEKEPIVNKFISVPKDKGTLNCAAFITGILEAVLNATNFPAKVSTHWHEGTTYKIKFEDHVISRDRSLEGK
ncbi:TRAPPC5 [Cordylochernes scorpioides]|uniref:Trafficking protein particle complex subunit 5 n=1 Tax=Cordylochernes scorpioides TaxID=51811 RepID=A0ABY6K884_9ARAC|nr:TRAPPC5 [Cordylochernes scorpioides]